MKVRLGVLLALTASVTLLAQTNLFQLRGRTDANGYLITAFGAYTGPDGPLTALANLRGKTDGNGYLLVTSPSTYGRSVAQTAAVASVVTKTVGAADASFTVSAHLLVTTSTTHSFEVKVTYTDEGNTSRVTAMDFASTASQYLAVVANTSGAVNYAGRPLHVRAKAGTTITVSTVGTFTTVTYNVEAIITPIV